MVTTNDATASADAGPHERRRVPMSREGPSDLSARPGRLVGMTIKDEILRAVVSDPMAVRAAFAEGAVLKALAEIGIGGARGIEVVELHAPAASARTSTGRGKTLCGRVSVRHAHVTCAACRKKAR